ALRTYAHSEHERHQRPADGRALDRRDAAAELHELALSVLLARLPRLSAGGGDPARRGAALLGCAPHDRLRGDLLHRHDRRRHRLRHLRPDDAQPSRSPHAPDPDRRQCGAHRHDRIAVVAIPLVGEEALSYLAYISVLAVVSVRRVIPGLVIAASTLIIAEATQRLVPGWSHDWSATFGISISGFAMVMALMAGDRARAARAAEEENRRLEREAERLRLSQNVHDVLGHSLTVIALKAQLAAKLQAAGAPEAADHIGEIETLARGALADVRTTVQGVRRISLAEELVAATRALRSADIEVEAPTSVDAVDGQLRELFAWSVREGSTNIL